MDEKNTLRVIHIDTASQRIEERQIPAGDGHLEALWKLVGGYIEVAARFANGDVLYVDEEGLLKEPERFFCLKHEQRPYAGNGVISRCDQEGEAASAASALTDIVERVVFMATPSAEEIKDPATITVTGPDGSTSTFRPR